MDTLRHVRNDSSMTYQFLFDKIRNEEKKVIHLILAFNFDDKIDHLLLSNLYHEPKQITIFFMHII